MRKYIIGFCAALLLIGTVAFMRQENSGILITGGFGGEPKLQASQPDQTAPWILFDNFQVPANGILPITYGGTGTNTAAHALETLGALASGTGGVKDGSGLTNLPATKIVGILTNSISGTATIAVTATNVQGFLLMTNNLVSVALVEQTNALGYVTNTYLTYTTNAFHYLGN